MTAVLPGFCKIECSDGRGRTCRTKIYHGGLELQVTVDQSKNIQKMEYAATTIWRTNKTFAVDYEQKCKSM